MPEQSSLPPDRPDPLVPIPLVVLSGFLGAGKTTRLNRWLKHPALADTLVIINEFGDIGLDHLLVEEAPGDIVLLAAGCLCCTVRGDLVATLEDLLRRRDNHRIRFFRQVLIETTGLADPLPILQSILQHPYLSKRFAIASVVTLVDVLHGAATLDTHIEARRQVALADTIVLTKTDVAPPPDDLLARLRDINPTVSPVAEARMFPAEQLFEPRFAPFSGENAALLGWLGEDGDRNGEPARHAPSINGIESFSLMTETPISEASLIVFQEAMRILHGPRLLRLKGLVALAEDPDRPVVIQHVQSIAQKPVRLPRWPSRDRRTRLVFITQGIARQTIEAFWQALVKPG
jgi:G3E family GTPase